MKKYSFAWVQLVFKWISRFKKKEKNKYTRQKSFKKKKKQTNKNKKQKWEEEKMKKRRRKKQGNKKQKTKKQKQKKTKQKNKTKHEVITSKFIISGNDVERILCFLYHYPGNPYISWAFWLRNFFFFSISVRVEVWATFVL